LTGEHIKSVWENAPPEMKNEDGSLKGGKMPALAVPTEGQILVLNNAISQIRSQETIPKFFDKDEPVHVRYSNSLALLCIPTGFRLLEIMCQIVASTHAVPPPDVMEIRKKAGNIIPSIISTTALISGFMLLNMLQIANDGYKFVNVNYGQVLFKRFYYYYFT
jgi:hypothetical protein